MMSISGQNLKQNNFSHNNRLIASISISVLLTVLAGCSPTSDNSESSASEKAAHDREVAAILISSVVTESTNHSIEHVIENNPAAKVLEACANRATESITTSLFAPVFEEGYAIALKEAASQSAQGSPGFPLADTDVKEISLNQIPPILDFYCKGWLAEQTVSPIN
ncbi:hypothetical protein [Leptothoe sp. PORK10 BA2]|uniref:hypothetical protein n=1 Tax=Leptothoe sp. PORK10 BA2 TaxID=3110254 RepID=UPI002B20B7F7|nr:hypothetical protein [Leptothoe sp. PORK10 BA2]MEA5462507.1 hypothetical protein [Leptothoe sp. PORK10 BA2]